MKKLKNSFIKLSSQSRLYQIPVPIIGLTGGIGTGKSTVAKLLGEMSIPVIDADKLVKNIYQKEETLEFIKVHFPSAVQNSEINFQELRSIAFQKPEAKKLIEDFIYARLPGEFQSAFQKLRDPTFIVYDVPLLFEKKLDSMIDLSLCIYAPKSIQINRIISRDNCSLDIANKIIEQQMDIEEKKKLSTFTIENTDSEAHLKIELLNLLTTICELP